MPRPWYTAVEVLFVHAESSKVIFMDLLHLYKRAEPAAEVSIYLNQHLFILKEVATVQIYRLVVINRRRCYGRVE